MKTEAYQTPEIERVMMPKVFNPPPDHHAHYTFDRTPPKTTPVSICPVMVTCCSRFNWCPHGDSPPAVMPTQLGIWSYGFYISVHPRGQGDMWSACKHKARGANSKDQQNDSMAKQMASLNWGCKPLLLLLWHSGSVCFELSKVMRQLS